MRRHLTVVSATLVIGTVLIYSLGEQVGLSAAAQQSREYYSSFFNNSWGDRKCDNSDSGVPPDPTQQPGWIENSEWVNSDPDIPMPHWMGRMIQNDDGEDMNWARNKTILFLGDSMLRGLLRNFCEAIKRPRRQVNLDTTQQASEKTKAWLCVHDTYNLSLINGFVYGVTDYSTFPPELIDKEWPPPPYNVEERIPDFIKQYEPYDPDIIMINSGAWDLKVTYKRDAFQGRIAESAIWGSEELRQYGERLRLFLKLVRKAFPRKKLLWLQLHAFNPEDTKARWVWARTVPGISEKLGVNLAGEPNPKQAHLLPHLFSRPRVAQLAQTYRRIAAQEGYDAVDSWKIGEALGRDFFDGVDAVHPTDTNMRIMLDFVLEKLFRLHTFGV